MVVRQSAAGNEAMPTPVPFTIRVPDEVLADLRERLDGTRWPDERPGGGWRYGGELAYMKELSSYWRRSFEWRVH